MDMKFEQNPLAGKQVNTSNKPLNAQMHPEPIGKCHPLTTKVNQSVT